MSVQNANTYTWGSTFKFGLDLSGQGLICVFLKREGKRICQSLTGLTECFWEHSAMLYFLLLWFWCYKKNNQGASLYFIRHLVTRVLTLALLLSGVGQVLSVLLFLDLLKKKKKTMRILEFISSEGTSSSWISINMQ